MTLNEHGDIPDLVYRLADGYTQHLKVASRHWTTLAIVSIIALIPNLNGSSIAFPFVPDLKVQAGDFYPAAAMLISIFVIGYGASNVQAIRTRKLVQRYTGWLNASGQAYVPPVGIHVQDIFDSIVTPSMNRVGPLAQILQGKTQVLAPEKRSPWPQALIATIYFVLLRGVGIAIIEFFPAYALAQSFFRGKLLGQAQWPWGIPVVLFQIVGVVAGMVLLQILVLETFWASRAIGRFWMQGPPSESQQAP